MFGRCIKNYLTNEGIENSVVAQKIGVTPSDFDLMLEGSRKISAEQYFKICRTLNVEIDFFAKFPK